MARATGDLSSSEQGVFYVHLSRARKHLQEDRYDVARKELELAQIARPNDEDVLNLLSVIEFKRGYYHEAAQAARALLKDNPTSAILHSNLGLILFKAGVLGEAEQELRRAIELQPDHVRSHLYLGLLYRMRGKLGLALEHLRFAGAKRVVTEIEETLRRAMRDPASRSVDSSRTSPALTPPGAMSPSILKLAEPSRVGAPAPLRSVSRPTTTVAAITPAPAAPTAVPDLPPETTAAVLPPSLVFSVPAPPAVFAPAPPAVVLMPASPAVSVPASPAVSVPASPAGPVPVDPAAPAEAFDGVESSAGSSGIEFLDETVRVPALASPVSRSLSSAETDRVHLPEAASIPFPEADFAIEPASVTHVESARSVAPASAASPSAAESRPLFHVRPDGGLEIASRGVVFVRKGSVVWYSGKMRFAAEASFRGTRLEKILRADGRGYLFVNDPGRQAFRRDVTGQSLYLEGSRILALDNGLSFRLEPIHDFRMNRRVDILKIFGRGSVILSVGGPLLAHEVSAEFPLNVSSRDLVAWTGDLVPSVLEDRFLEEVMMPDVGSAPKIRFEGQGTVLTEPPRPRRRASDLARASEADRRS